MSDYQLVNQGIIVCLRTRFGSSNTEDYLIIEECSMLLWSRINSISNYTGTRYDLADGQDVYVGIMKHN